MKLPIYFYFYFLKSQFGLDPLKVLRPNRVLPGFDRPSATKTMLLERFPRNIHFSLESGGVYDPCCRAIGGLRFIPLFSLGSADNPIWPARVRILSVPCTAGQMEWVSEVNVCFTCNHNRLVQIVPTLPTSFFRFVSFVGSKA